MATFPSLDIERELADWSQTLGPLLEPLVGSGLDVSPSLGEKPASSDRMKFCVRDASGERRLNVVVSPATQPDLGARAIECAAAAKRVLGPELGDRIQDPVHTGVALGRSFAVFPYLAPVRGLAGLMRARWLAPPLQGWLRQVAAHTLGDVGSADQETRFQQPLRHLLEREGISGRVRTASEYFLYRLRDGKLPARFVLMHGNLTADNVLLASQGVLRRPRTLLAGWSGALIRGYAIFDLVCLARSFRLTPEQLHTELEHHAELLGCEVDDTRGHLLAALGYCGIGLEGDLVRRYLARVETCMDTISEAL